MSEHVPWKKALDVLVAEMRAMYGHRLRRVLLYGSRARGDADDDSDIDVLAVLNDVDSFWDELARLGPLASRISLDHDVVISVIPVDAEELTRAQTPLLLNSQREGVTVG